MKINKEFVLREIAGESMLVPSGAQAQKLDGIIALNPVAAVIWKALCEKPDYQYALEKILDTFEVSENEAKQDLNDFIDQMCSHDLLIEE